MAKKDLPTICIAGFHSCIRAYKIGLALKSKGYRVRWMANMTFPSHVSFHHFDGIYAYQLGTSPAAHNVACDPKVYFDSFKKSVELAAKDCDLFHWYNEPDWGVREIKAVCDNPVVYDLHDLRSDREFTVTEDEEDAFNQCDAILAQGPVYKEMCAKRRPDLAEQGKISYILPGVNREMWPSLGKRMVNVGNTKIGGIVYEGGLTSNPANGNELPYRWWAPFMSELTKRNLRVTCHTSSGGDYSAYTKAGVRVISTLPFELMLHHLTMYDWGLVGNAINHPAFDAAMPNKLFEYIAAGIPVMVYDSKLVADFVTKEGIGVVVNSPDDVVKAFPTCREYEKKVLKAREKWCMENQIGIYEKLINKLV